MLVQKELVNLYTRLFHMGQLLGGGDCYCRYGKRMILRIMRRDTLIFLHVS